MTREMELIRSILLEVEARKPEDRFRFRQVVVEGYDEATIAGHVELLAEAGYLEAKDLTTLGRDYRVMVPIRLTWDGHEFLESISNETVWAYTKDKLATIGGAAPLEIVKAVAAAITKTMLGL